MNSTLKFILYLLSGLAVLGILLYVFVFYKGTIVIGPTPYDAKTIIANQEKTGAAKFRLKPGSYNVKIEAPGYVSYEKRVDLKSAQKITLNISLRKTPEPTKIISQETKFLFSGLDDTLLYLADGGKTLYRIGNLSLTNPEITAITPNTFSDLTKIIWAPERDLAVLKKAESTFLYDFKRYDLLHQEIHNWPAGIGDLIWSPDGKNTAYYFNPIEGERTIIRADRSNENLERLYNLKETAIVDPKLDWSKDSKKILIYTTDIYILDTYTKDFSRLTQNETINGALFTPDSQNIIFSNNQGLYIMDILGKNKRALDLKTSAKKIVFYSDEKNILAAVPQAGKSDQLIKINIESGEKKSLSFESKTAMTFSNLTLLSEEKTLYFLSNEGLYSLDLTANEY